MTRSMASNPRQLAAEARKQLRSAASHWPPVRATQFFKPEEMVFHLSISAPRLRKIEGKLYASVRATWGYAEAVQFADALLRERHLEGRSLGLMLLSRYAKDFELDLFTTVHQWLSANRCDNWALTDLLGAKVLAPLIQRYPALAEKLKGWTASRNLWVRRASLVALVPLARHGLQLALAYSVATKLQKDGSDLIQKAAGWLLRECGQTNPRRLATYLMAHGPRVPRTTLRYAIEGFPKPQRDDLMERTKAAGTPA
jgi:3-methyladenine DNA glycosylase AlkD